MRARPEAVPQLCRRTRSYWCTGDSSPRWPSRTVPGSVADPIGFGATFLGRDAVVEGGPETDKVRTEATFPDGTELVTVHEPLV